jgi:hypothetical protein
VDIDTKEKPVVIILTDVYNAPFSAIDPATEGYQAVGRFRNGVDGIYHVTNWNHHIDAKSRDAVFHRLNSLELAYRSVEYSMNGVDNIGKAAIQQVLDKMEYHRCLHRGKRNYFM